MLTLILAIEAGYLYYLRFISKPVTTPELLQLIHRADSLHLLLKEELSDTASASNYVTVPPNRNFHDTLFRFNPNDCSVSDFQQLGLSYRQSQVIDHYRRAGGRFKQKSDLQKMKVISVKQFQRWKSFIDLPDTLIKCESKKQEKIVAIVDLCSADSVALDKLNGISPFMAGRIVRFRNRLGGFISTDQLKEVYGLNDTTFNMLLKQVKLNCEKPVRMISINTIVADSLKLHPYIGWQMARQMIQYRKQHPFRTIDEIRLLPLVTPEIYRKLAPYLEVR